MITPWDLPDFDDHEGVHLFRDASSGLTAVIAVHSTALGPAAGGTRFWHYADRMAAVTDSLRLSRGMSYKNAMAGLPMGGGKAVILSDATGSKDQALITAFAGAVDSLAGRYVTAQDVGMSEADMITISSRTPYVCGLPAAPGEAGGDPGPSTALGVYNGVIAAIKHALGRDDARGVHVAIQGVGSVGGGLARLLARDGARLTIADASSQAAEVCAHELGAAIASPEDIMEIDADVFSPCALGAIFDAHSIARLKVAAVAGGANNQLASAIDGDALMARGILYAPDYVINAGGIINVGVQYMKLGDANEVEKRIAGIAPRLNQIWQESKSSGLNSAAVADRIAQRLIGR